MKKLNLKKLREVGSGQLTGHWYDDTDYQFIMEVHRNWNAMVEALDRSYFLFKLLAEQEEEIGNYGSPFHSIIARFEDEKD